MNFSEKQLPCKFAIVLNTKMPLKTVSYKIIVAMPASRMDTALKFNASSDNDLERCI